MNLLKRLQEAFVFQPPEAGDPRVKEKHVPLGLKMSNGAKIFLTTADVSKTRGGRYVAKDCDVQYVPAGGDEDEFEDWGSVIDITFSVAGEKIKVHSVEVDDGQLRIVGGVDSDKCEELDGDVKGVEGALNSKDPVKLRAFIERVKRI